VLEVPIVVPSTAKLTEATATLSVALTCMLTVPETVDPLVGEVILTVGGVASVPDFTGFPLALNISGVVMYFWVFDKNSLDITVGTLATFAGSSGITPDIRTPAISSVEMF
jgi:hypothetical protein